jgi:hypothetical protein
MAFTLSGNAVKMQNRISFHRIVDSKKNLAFGASLKFSRQNCRKFKIGGKIVLDSSVCTLKLFTVVIVAVS